MATLSRWAGFSSLDLSRLAAEITAFIGVRISWLMVARKSDLAALATSALARSSLALRLASRIASVVTEVCRTATTRWPR